MKNVVLLYDLTQDEITPELLIGINQALHDEDIPDEYQLKATQSADQIALTIPVKDEEEMSPQEAFTWGVMFRGIVERVEKVVETA